MSMRAWLLMAAVITLTAANTGTTALSITSCGGLDQNIVVPSRNGPRSVSTLTRATALRLLRGSGPSLPAVIYRIRPIVGPGAGSEFEMNETLAAGGVLRVQGRGRNSRGVPYVDFRCNDNVKGCRYVSAFEIDLTVGVRDFDQVTGILAEGSRARVDLVSFAKETAVYSCLNRFFEDYQRRMQRMPEEFFEVEKLMGKRELRYQLARFDDGWRVTR